MIHHERLVAKVLKRSLSGRSAEGLFFASDRITGSGDYRLCQLSDSFSIP